MLLGAMGLVGCSIDAERTAKNQEAAEQIPEVTKTSECFSCVAKDGLELQICDFMNDTYSLKHGDNTYSLITEDMEGHSPKKFVEIGCQLDTLELGG